METIKLQKLEDALLKHKLADTGDMDDRSDMGDRGDMHDIGDRVTEVTGVTCVKWVTREIGRQG